MNLKLGLILCAILHITVTTKYDIDSSSYMLDSFRQLQKEVDFDGFKQISTSVLPPDLNYNKRVRDVLKDFSLYVTRASDAYERGHNDITSICSSSVVSIPHMLPLSAEDPTVFDDILKDQYSSFGGACADLENAASWLQKASETFQCLDPNSNCIPVLQLTINQYVNGKVEIEVDGFENLFELKTVLTQAADQNYVAGQSKYEINNAATLGYLNQDRLEYYKVVLDYLRQAKAKIDNTIMTIKQKTVLVDQPGSLEQTKFNSFVSKCQSFLSKKK